MPRNEPNKVLRISGTTATVNARDYRQVLCDTTSNAIALVLISPGGTSEWGIKIKNTGSTGNDVTITVNGGFTVDGASSYPISPGAGAVIEQDDTGNLWVFGSSARIDFSLWSPDAPPATPRALDDEFDIPGVGVPAGWTKFDPANRLTVSVEGGLHLVAAPVGGIDNDPDYILATTALLDNHTYNVFDHQPDVPRYISVTLVADTDESFIAITLQVNGTDPNGDPVSRTVGPSGPVGSVTVFNRAFATVTSIVSSGGVGITGDETISVGIHTAAPALCGIYKEIPPLDEDGSWIIKLCGGGQIDNDVAFAGLAFFEDAEDPTKFIYCFGEHWYADVQTVQYDKWFGPRSVLENTDAHSGYLRIRRNDDGYFMDFSAQGLSFATSSEFTELNLGITPKHVGLVVDNTDAVSMGAAFAFFRYKSSDVGLTGVLEGARVKGFYA